MSKHPVILRTSEKGPGKPFLGRCPACGKEGITFGMMNTDHCPKGDAMSQEQALRIAMEPLKGTN